MRHFVVVPVRVKERDERLGVDALRVVGYRCADYDGWRGPVRSTVREARTDKPVEVSSSSS